MRPAIKTPSPEDLPFAHVLDDRERALVRHVLTTLRRAHGGPAGANEQTILDGGERLLVLWRAIEQFPRTRACQTLGWRRRDLDTLQTQFASCQFFSLEAVLPTRAALARAFGMAKLNFTRMLRYIIKDALGDQPQGEALFHEAEGVQRSAVAAIIGEDVLRRIASDEDLSATLRRSATDVLASLWDQRASHSLADFAPTLDQLWLAKTQVRIRYGTLQGMSELYQLLANGCPENLLEMLLDEDEDPERFWAFEEFMFNATHEELCRMRDHMVERGEQALGDEEVAALFGVPLERLHVTTATPKDMFFTFREREMWARIRRVSGRSGPKRTAEEYVMIYVLGRRAALGASPPLT